MGLISTFAYKGLMKKAISRYKYNYVTSLADTLHELIITHTDFSPLSTLDWTIVPVPLHPKRLRWRGFNQAELLAKALSQYTQWPIDTNLLFRTRFTPSQMSLTRSKRLSNLNKAFTIHHIPKSNPILLIDDVWTTGSTLTECACTLKQAGVKHIWAYTIARTCYSSKHAHGFPDSNRRCSWRGVINNS